MKITIVKGLLVLLAGVSTNFQPVITKKYFIKCIKIFRRDKEHSTNAALANCLCKWCLCLFPHCSMQRKDVNHNQLWAVGHSASCAPFHKCTQMWRKRCQFSTCDFHRRLQELCVCMCVYWQKVRQSASKKTTRMKPRVSSTCIWKGLGGICITLKKPFGEHSHGLWFR